jgi:hypothetical protein
MDLRTLLYLFFGLALVNSIVSGIAIIAFLSSTKAIRNQKDLKAFKAVARQNMYQALAQIVFLLGCIVIGIYGLVTKRIDLVLVLVLNGVILILGMVMKRFEEKARKLPIGDQILQQDYAHAAHSWTHKAFPDF